MTVARRQAIRRWDGLPSPISSKGADTRGLGARWKGAELIALDVGHDGPEQPPVIAPDLVERPGAQALQAGPSHLDFPC